MKARIIWKSHKKFLFTILRAKRVASIWIFGAKIQIWSLYVAIPIPLPIQRLSPFSLSRMRSITKKTPLLFSLQTLRGSWSSKWAISRHRSWISANPSSSRSPRSRSCRPPTPPGRTRSPRSWRKGPKSGGELRKWQKGPPAYNPVAKQEHSRLTSGDLIFITTSSVNW